MHCSGAGTSGQRNGRGSDKDLRLELGELRRVEDEKGGRDGGRKGRVVVRIDEGEERVDERGRQAGKLPAEEGTDHGVAQPDAS